MSISKQILRRALAATVVLSAVALPAGAYAQSAPTAPAQQQAAPQQQTQEPKLSQAQQLEQAFQREFAFLAEQKRELERRLADFRASAAEELQKTEASLNRLESQLLSQESRAETLQEQLNESERMLESRESDQELVGSTLSQAGTTLGEYGIGFLEEEGFQTLPEDQKLARTFAAGRQLAASLDGVREVQGPFFLSDGTEANGTIVHLGNIAAYGVSEAGAGLLAPAGAGRLKIWADQPAPEVARAVAAGDMPPVLPTFLYESLDADVESGAGETVLEHIASGGTIAWVIVALGVLAAVLAALRAAFLKAASSRTDRIESEVSALVRKGKVTEALEVCRRLKGSTSRVVAAALRNLDRDREHLEDIVSEAIINESRHLNRFGALILVLAAVSPLLGLLGTVTGMIATFDVITKFGTGDPQLLSGGISTALVTTELGLIVAIPALLVGNLLAGWAERIKDDMEKAALRVSNTYYDAADQEHVRAAPAAARMALGSAV